MSLGKRMAGALLNYLFGKAPSATPAGVIYVSLYTADPGEDGQGAGAATGSGYARVATAAADWVAATNADPAVIANANVVTFPTATGTWSAGANFTHAALWDHATNTAEANYLGMCILAVPKPVINTDIASFAAGALTMSMD